MEKINSNNRKSKNSKKLKNSTILSIEIVN